MQCCKDRDRLGSAERLQSSSGKLGGCSLGTAMLLAYCCSACHCLRKCQVFKGSAHSGRQAGSDVGMLVTSLAKLRFPKLFLSFFFLFFHLPLSFSEKQGPNSLKTNLIILCSVERTLFHTRTGLSPPFELVVCIPAKSEGFILLKTHCEFSRWSAALRQIQRAFRFLMAVIQAVRKECLENHQLYATTLIYGFILQSVICHEFLLAGISQ